MYQVAGLAFQEFLAFPMSAWRKRIDQTAEQKLRARIPVKLRVAELIRFLPLFDPKMKNTGASPAHCLTRKNAAAALTEFVKGEDAPATSA